MTVTVARPTSVEHPEYHTAYISLVPEGDVLDVLEEQREETSALLGGIDEERAGHRYAPGKWSIKEVVAHVVDTERVFAYRAMRFARGDTTPLPGVEQNVLVAGGNFDGRSLASLIAEYRDLRRSNITLFGSFDEPALVRSGTADGSEISVRALIFVIAGHERHHMNVIRERYL